MTRALPTLLLLGLFSPTLLAAAPPVFPTTPGYHADLPLPGAPGQTFDLYLPRAYADRNDHPDVRFPVVYLLAAGGKSHLVDWADQHKVLSWAESFRCVVIGVNTFFDAEPSGQVS